MLTSSNSNMKWCHSVGESCNFMGSYILDFVLAYVIANDSGLLGFVLGRCYCHVAIDLGNLVLFMTDVIAMLPWLVVLCWKCLRLTFSSDLEEAMLETGERLSSIKNKFCFWEIQLIYKTLKVMVQYTFYPVIRIAELNIKSTHIYYMRD